MSGLSQCFEAITGLAGNSKGHKQLVSVEEGWRFTRLQGQGWGWMWSGDPCSGD